MGTRPVDQLALDEKVVDDPAIEKLLEARQKAKDAASIAAAKAKTASEAAADAVSKLDLGNGTAIRIGRFRIDLVSRPARAVSFETPAKEGVRISLIDEDK